MAGVTVPMEEKYTLKERLRTVGLIFQLVFLVGFIESGALLPSNVYLSSVSTRTPHRCDTLYPTIDPATLRSREAANLSACPKNPS
jgi:hypothetical protein